MKKFFTLIAAALMTVGVMAQQTITLYHPTGDKLNVLEGELLGAGVADGWKMQCLNTEKNLEQAAAITVDGVGYRSIKVSNGAQSQIWCPEGIVMTKVTVYSYVNIDAPNRTPYWAEVNGETYTEETATIMQSYKDGENPDVATFDLGGVSTFTITNKGEQPCVVFVIEYTEGGVSGGDDPAPTGNVAGIYRPLDLVNLEVGDCSVAEAFGVKVTPIRGAKATYREEAVDPETGENKGNSKDASDLYLGYKYGEDPAANQAASAVYAADEVIFPFVAEQSARQEDEFFGFTMEIPEGKSVNIDEIDAYLLAANAYQWQIELTDGAGNVVYKTQDKGIKINNYNKTAYTNGVHVTTTEVTEPEWSQGILESWKLAPNYDVADTEVLPELKDLTGTYTVKVYYWGKWQKNLTYANVSLILSQGATGISSAINDSKAENNVMYNLAGQRIAAPVSGQIYILNGKKYIAK